MNNLQTNIQKYVRQINESVFELKTISLDELDEIEKEIIDYKLEIVRNNKGISLYDLALVRIMNSEDFPIDLEYHTLQEDGKTAFIESPFDRLISYIANIKEYEHIDLGCNRSLIDPNKLKIEYPLYRNTKHFAINGLCSNVVCGFYTLGSFNNKEIIAIEPFIDHLDDNLVNLNPVDTFYNLEQNSFKMSDKTVFVIDTNTYKRIITNPVIRENLSRVKVFLYNPNNKYLAKRYNVNIQTVMTDITLSYLGYVPEHSTGQIKLKKESYFNGKEFIEDTEYLKLFQDYMEYLNKVLLNKSYYKLPKNILDKRIIHDMAKDSIIIDNALLGLPGLLHSETKYYEEEVKVQIEIIINTIKSYLNFLVTELGLDKNVAKKLFLSYSQHIKENYGQYFATVFFTLDIEKDLIPFLKKVGYSKLVETTNKFNETIKNTEKSKCR